MHYMCRTCVLHVYLEKGILENETFGSQLLKHDTMWSTNCMRDAIFVRPCFLNGYNFDYSTSCPCWYIHTNKCCLYQIFKMIKTLYNYKSRVYPLQTPFFVTPIFVPIWPCCLDIDVCVQSNGGDHYEDWRVPGKLRWIIAVNVWDRVVNSLSLRAISGPLYHIILRVCTHLDNILVIELEGGRSTRSG